MADPSNFIIYNASAGSGKTYTLVKEFLKILLGSNNNFLFKNILAITFTNKAVNEMKERIIKMLSVFSKETILTDPHPMFVVLSNELNMPFEVLRQKSDILLKFILHNYASLNISTIDGFTHKLIRTFAFDLKIPINFEVELDTDSLLNVAVDRLIAKVGTNKDLTQVMVDFAIEKADEDKSWDISYDLNKIGQLLFMENDLRFLKTFEDKTLEDFKVLKQLLKTEILKAENYVSDLASEALTLIEEAGLRFEDFSGGSRAYLPNYFLKLKNLNLTIDYTAAWILNLEAKPLYPLKTSEEKKHIIDALQPTFVSMLTDTKTAVFNLKFLNAFYRNITPLSILNALQNELITLKKEQNILTISEFNALISNEIKNQPTPFIYERLGEKFKHYFIDEFQDTSIMQWQNLIPLIANALSTENTSAFIVGDAKQSIYRWRGGKPEQFIGLLEDQNPFQIKKHLRSLDNNFRSHKAIVNFNNSFFEYLSSLLFEGSAYQPLYSKVAQNIKLEPNGYVHITFLPIEKEDDKGELYAEKVLHTIYNCKNNGYDYQDICILVRKKDGEALPLATYLSQKNVPVISSESLLIANSKRVGFLNNFLILKTQPNNHLIKVELLNFLATHFNVQDKHDFLFDHIHLPLNDLLERFNTNFNVDLTYQDFEKLPIYDLVETLVRCFGLIQTSDAYVQSYMDVVFEYIIKNGSDLIGFLEHFEKNKHRLSISSPEGQNAVQIMTIHKSKGLEFPIVIFPYADLDIYKEIEPKEWYSVNPKNFNGYTHTLLNYNKDVQEFGDQGLTIHNRHQDELLLDNINLLYVALTRPIEQLHIISKNDTSSEKNHKLKRFSELFISYLQAKGLWEESKLEYSFGDPKKSSLESKSFKKEKQALEFISTSKEDHNINIITKQGLLWDTKQNEAIEKGNLIHDILSEIITKDDLETVLNTFELKGIIDKKQCIDIKKHILHVINHPKLKACFEGNVIVYTEKDIIDVNGILLRPDRITIDQNNQATLIDYKTGIPNDIHKEQLELYKDELERMGIVVRSKYLVYLTEAFSVVQI